MLRIQKDLKNAETRVQMQLKSLADNSTETTTTIAKSQVIRARVKIKTMRQRAVKRHSLRKMAKSHDANTNPSIRKIHIRLEKRIHITTNSCQQKSDNHECAKAPENRNEKVSQNLINIRQLLFERRELEKLFFLFGVRLLREIFWM